MSYDPYPGMGLKTWHVVVFLGLVVLVADIVSIQMLGTKSNQFQFAVAPAETIEIPVAARDLPVGTYLSTNEMLWVTKKVPKTTVTPETVTEAADLIDARLMRSLRAGQTFRSDELSRGPLRVPPGMSVTTLPFNSAQEDGFIVPGSRVDVIADLRIGKKQHAFPIVVNLLVVAVETSGPADALRTFASVAVSEKQALLLKRAQAHGCQLKPVLRRPDQNDSGHDIDMLIQMFAEPGNEVRIVPEPQPPMPAIEEPGPAIAPPPRPIQR